MHKKDNPKQVVAELEAFLEDFKQYGKEVYSKEKTENFEGLGSRLRRSAPRITDIILKIVGDGTFQLGYSGYTSYKDLMSVAVMGGNNALPHNFRDFEAPVFSILEKTIGTIESGLWPPKTPTPVLIVHDPELRQRCADLLSAPGNYDRAIREATTILEDRIRGKLPHTLLSRLIPHSTDQMGENLVNKLFSPDEPILSVSDDKKKRIAFHKILMGIFSYLRNEYHHKIDDRTQWSWAWSTVGFIDRLLVEIDSCTLREKQ